MKTLRIAVMLPTVALLAATVPVARAQQTTSTAPQSSPSASKSAASQASVPTANVQSPRVTAYTLPPDLYKKARDRSRIEFRLALIGFVYGLIVLWVILHWRVS